MITKKSRKPVRKAKGSPRAPAGEVLLSLPPDLAVDLPAFCDAHYDATKQRVLRDALRRFIDEELQAESARFRERFAAAKRRLGGSQEPVIHVIRGGRETT